MSKPITIIIVNWNGGRLLWQCVTSIQAYHSNLVDQVVVVDNASTDDSMAVLETVETLVVRVRSIRNEVNRGFAAACNQGAALADSKYLLFLNPDAELMPNSLDRPYAYMEDPNHSDVGIVGIQLVGEDGAVARSCARFPSPARFLAYSLGINRIPPFRASAVEMKEWAHEFTRNVDHVIGAFYFTRRAIFAAINGFDERFFVYYEDVDYSLRARERGYRSVYLATSWARHVGGGTSRKIKARRLYYSMQSRLLYSFKHFGALGSVLTLVTMLTLEPIARLTLAVLTGSPEDARNTLAAYRILYAALPQIVARAKQ